jgi:hypothetical protein
VFPVSDDVGECRSQVHWNGRPRKPRCSRWNFDSIYDRTGVTTTSGLLAAILCFRLRRIGIQAGMESHQTASVDMWLLRVRYVGNFTVIICYIMTYSGLLQNLQGFRFRPPFLIQTVRCDFRFMSAACATVF